MTSESGMMANVSDISPGFLGLKIEATKNAFPSVPELKPAIFVGLIYSSAASAK